MEDTRSDVQECFDSMRDDFESKGFDVSGGATEYSIDLLPGSVEINLEKRIVKGEMKVNSCEASRTVLVVIVVQASCLQSVSV